MKSTILSRNLLLLGLACASDCANAAPVPLRNATATFSQNVFMNFPPFPVSQAIDGARSGYNGWSAFPEVGGKGQVAAFETATPAGFQFGTTLRFSIISAVPEGQHGLGRFRISATVASQETFADGLQRGGDVETEWTTLIPRAVSATSGVVLNINVDHSIRASGPNPTFVTYRITCDTNLREISGFRLEALPDPSLPAGGPGRASNGNFFVSEFEVDAEPVAIPLTVRVSELELRFRSVAGTRYQLQTASDAIGEWINHGLVFVGTGDDIVLSERQLDAGKQFYRVVLAP
jgi:hypothetical protein